MSKPASPSPTPAKDPTDRIANLIVRHRIRFSQTDVGAIMFFPQVFPMAHDAYEEMVRELGFAWKDWFCNGDWGVPIRHSECDYRKPMEPGVEYEIHVRIEHIGDSSLVMKYAFMKGPVHHAEVTLVHTFVDLKNRVKVSIPGHVRQKLEAYQLQRRPS